MKQPELGRKIAELRKAKGLTQEELVEQCRVSVRTLQRIESGEVTPRSFTVRTILAALDYSDASGTSAVVSDATSRTGISSNWLEQCYLYVFDLFNLKTDTMKKISVLSLTTVALAFGLVAVFSDTEAQTSKEFRKAISASNEKFVTWFNAGQADSLANLYSVDACLVGRGCGREFIKEYYARESGTYKMKELQTLDIKFKDGVATETGKFRFSAAKGLEITGTYQSEWKLIDNRWRIVKDMLVDNAN